MRTFTHPETGEHTAASNTTAARLLDEGWTEIGETTYAEPSKSRKPKQDPEPKPNGDDGSDEEKPLDKMNMIELVAYADKIGMPDAAALKKPGSSKKQAKDTIESFLAASQQ